jgi:hypothetical protein
VVGLRLSDLLTVLSYTQKWLDSVCDLLNVLSYTEVVGLRLSDLLAVFYIDH